MDAKVMRDNVCSRCFEYKVCVKEEVIKDAKVDFPQWICVDCRNKADKEGGEE